MGTTDPIDLTSSAEADALAIAAPGAPGPPGAPLAAPPGDLGSARAVASAHDAQATQRIVSSARWFWWIAGLSLVNTIMAASGSDSSFVMGLAMTTVLDVMFEANRFVGYGLEAVVLAFFLFIGMQASRQRLWAFYVGVTVYVLDALVYAGFQDWMPVAFHALAIFFIAKGMMVLRERNAGGPG